MKKERIEIYKSGLFKRWTWRLLANNGNILTKGGKFKTLSGCKQGISIVEKIFGKIPKKIVLD